MKKQYVAPMADKVDFDYEENVVASGAKQHDCNVSSKSWSWSWSWSGSFSIWDLLKKIFR